MSKNHKYQIKFMLFGAVAALSVVASIFAVNSINVKAEEGDKEITCFGTSIIGNPVQPGSVNDAWQGDYLWYGEYGYNKPIKYRVLQNDCEEFGTKSIFVDCDSVLFTEKYDKDGNPNESGKAVNDWNISDVKSFLNGSEFLNFDRFFDSRESGAIVTSRKDAHALVDPNSNVDLSEYYVNYVALDEKVFLLDGEDICNPVYGYSADAGSVKNRIKNSFGTENAAEWWLRSARLTDKAGTISTSGRTSCSAVTNYSGVSPAFCIDSSKVLFTTLVPGTENEYKLTLMDENIQIAVASGKSVTNFEYTVKIPYAISGSNKDMVNKVSLLILDKPWAPGNLDATVLEYKSGYWSDNPNDTMTYVLPDSLKNKVCGTDYYAYILAEDTYGSCETDFASQPVQITIPARTTTMYKVSYDANDATSGNVPAEVTEYEKNTEITVLGNTGNLAKTKHHFAGWNTKKDGTGVSYAPNDKITLTGNVVFYAVWEKDNEIVGVEINEDNFPDETFRNYVKDNFDSVSDGVLTEAEIKNIKEIDVSGELVNQSGGVFVTTGTVTTLEGIEYFTELETLECNYNQIKTLDLNHTTKLKTLRCMSNQLETLNVNGCTSLEKLICRKNKLTSLDVRGCTSLNYLHADINNLVTINLSECGALETAILTSNELTELNVSNCTKLKMLNFTDNHVDEINVSNCPDLEDLECHSNRLYQLDISNNPKLYYFRCEFNSIQELDISNNPTIIDLYRYYKKDVDYTFTYYRTNDYSKFFSVDNATVINDGDRVENGWKEIKEKWYYFKDGEKVTGWNSISKTWYYFNKDGVMQTGWLKDGNSWYYLASSGAMQTGWVKDNNKWYYMSSGGVMQTGWVKVNHNWYYMNSAMQTGWVRVNGTWYFFKPSGVMAENEWYDGYWFSKGGAWTYKAKGSWKQNSKGWWFGDTSGWYAKSTTIKINDKNYTFGSDGYWNKK